MTDHTKLHKALAELKAQYHLLSLDTHDLLPVLQRAVKNSVVQCFEIAFDMLWKSLKKYLEEQGVTKIPNSPKSVFRKAHENYLIEDIEPWINGDESYVALRNDTAHDYSEVKADKTIAKIGDFIEDADALYQKMVNDD